MYNISGRKNEKKWKKKDFEHKICSKNGKSYLKNGKVFEKMKSFFETLNGFSLKNILAHSFMFNIDSAGTAAWTKSVNIDFTP